MSSDGISMIQYQQGLSDIADISLVLRSKLEDAAGRRVAFEGIANVKIKNGLIYQYSEVADTFPALQRLGFTSDRIGKMASKAASRLESRHELSGHL